LRGNSLGKLILVAPAAFKGSFSPRAVADAIAAGVRRAAPEATVLLCPVADGGDGLLDAVLPPGSLRERVQVSGPLGMPVPAELGWIDPETAILESSTACGLALLPVEVRDPLRTTTRGVGELLWEAVDRGAHTVVVGMGGSATVDGGTGAARGFGWTFQDVGGAPLPEGGGALAELASCASGWGLEAQVVALADVTTPLVGPQGAAPVFGPQKGATAENIVQLAAGLDRLAALMARQGHPELATLPGGGAAGGLGAGLVFFAGARIVPGAEWVLERVGFDAALAKADLVLTGEGSLDRTSRVGKATGEVIRRAQAARKPVAVVAGRVEEGADLPAYGGGGATLDAAGIAALAERATRDALGLPASPAPS
jgi:glycerate kinase